MTSPPRLFAVIVSGGRSSRMGHDKASLVLRGRTLLEWTIAACSAAHHIVVVGEPVELATAVSFVREEPAFGGPVAALAAGLAVLPATEPADEVLFFATDLINPQRLVDLLATHPLAATEPGVALVDDEGVMQYLAARYRLSALRRRVDEWGDPHGASLRKFMQPLTLATITDHVADVDTPQQWRLLSDDCADR